MEQQRLKMHRRDVYVNGRSFTALSPRPDEAPTFTIDPEQEPLNVIADDAGAALLGQLCWAMAFQRSESTIVVIDGPGGDTGVSALVIANSDLVGVSAEDAEGLTTLLPWTTPSDGTVTLNIRSLESALEQQDRFYAQQKRDGVGDIKHQARMVKELGDLVVIAAPAVLLKSWGVQLCTPADGRPTWLHGA